MKTGILTLGANNVTLEGLKFQHSSYYGMDGYKIGNAAVKVFNSKGISINNYQFAHTDMTGLSSNDYFDGCGTSRFWEPSCMFIIVDNIQVVNNEITANGGIFVKSLPHGASYWTDSGVVEPTRDDFLIHIEYNHVHHFGQAMLSDFSAVKTGISTVSCDGASFTT
jgi:hypothetical protein